jgi:hypothetical protein
MRMRVPISALLKFSLAIATCATAADTVAAHAATTTPRDATVPLTAVEDGTVSGLVPSGAAQDIDYTIINSNSTPVYAAAVTISMTNPTYVASAGSGVGTTWDNHPAGGPAPGCTAADFTIVQPDPLDAYLPVGTTSFTRFSRKKSGTIAMRNTGGDQNDCQGTTAKLVLSIS